MRKVGQFIFMWIIGPIFFGWLLKKAPGRLVEDALLGWVNDQIGKWLTDQPTMTSAIEVLASWGPPVLIGILLVMSGMYIARHKPSKSWRLRIKVRPMVSFIVLYALSGAIGGAIILGTVGYYRWQAQPIESQAFSKKILDSSCEASMSGQAGPLLHPLDLEIPDAKKTDSGYLLLREENLQIALDQFESLRDGYDDVYEQIRDWAKSPDGDISVWPGLARIFCDSTFSMQKTAWETIGFEATLRYIPTRRQMDAIVPEEKEVRPNAVDDYELNDTKKRFFKEVYYKYQDTKLKASEIRVKIISALTEVRALKRLAGRQPAQ